MTAQWLTGFRISEILSLSICSVYRDGNIPELSRALESYLAYLKKRYEITPDLPLFLSRQDNADGTARSLCRESARKIIRAAFARAGVVDDGRLGTHSLRKTFARRVYENSGHDLLVLKKALGHSDVQVTQKYLEVSEDEVMAAMAKVDFTRGPQRRKSSGVGEGRRARTQNAVTEPVPVSPPAGSAVSLDRPAA